jgi:Ca2+-binding EF-hand superfamily protein
LNSKYDFSIKRCFEAIDKAYPYNTLNRNEIRTFVAEYRTKLSEDDLDAIIRRCDTDEDETIDQNEFEDAIKYVIIEPVVNKFLSGLGHSGYNGYNGSPLRGNEYRGYNATGSPLRHSNTMGALSNTYNWGSIYDRYNGRDTIGHRSFVSGLSPARGFSSWKDLSSRYRSYHRDGMYNHGSLYDHDLDNRDYRHTYLDSIGRNRYGDLRHSTSQRRIGGSPILMSRSIYHDNLSATKRVPFRRNSPGSYDYFRTSSPRSAMKNSLRFTTMYDQYNSRKSNSPKRTRTSANYSPARTSLKTRFDIADELVEEHRTPVKGERYSSSKKSGRTTHTLASNEQDSLVESLRDLIEIDKQLEKAKVNLALRTDFTLYDGYRVFDFHNTGYADLDDIIAALQVFQIHPTREEARLFMTRFDLNKNNRLSYPEIAECFLPLTDSSEGILRKRSAEFPSGYYKRTEELSVSTVQALEKVLKLHIDVELNAERLRQKHEESPHFRYDDAFTTLNKWGDDYLTPEDFAEIFKKYGFYATKSELDMLIGRFDKNKDGKVSYDEFFEEFSPHSPLKV